MSGIHGLGRLAIIVGHQISEKGNAALLDSNPDIAERTQKRLDALLPVVTLCGLKGSVHRIERMGRGMKNAAVKWTLPVLLDRLVELTVEIIREVNERVYLHMPNPEYYEQKELFGIEVAKRFPRANQEIIEAGNCYTTGSNTACVFHLMRAVEIGAHSMVKGLRVTGQLPRKLELCDWGELLGALNAGLNAAAVGRRMSLSTSQRSEFYNHAVAQFRNSKDAWRNNVSHGRKIYKPGETKDILDNTRQFMQHLATRLKE